MSGFLWLRLITVTVRACLLGKVFRIILVISSLKELALSLDTFTPAHRHVINCSLKLLPRCATQERPNFLLERLNVGHPSPSELLLEGGECPKVTRHEVGTIGRMAQEVHIIFTIKSKGWHCHMGRRIVEMQSEVAVSCSIESILPHDGAFPPHTVLEPLHDFQPVVRCDCHSRWHKLKVDDAQSVKKEDKHCLPSGAWPECFLRPQRPFLQPLAWSLFCLWFKQWKPRFVCRDDLLH